MRLASWISAAVAGGLLITLVILLHGCGGSGGQGGWHLAGQHPAGDNVYQQPVPPAPREFQDLTDVIEHFSPAAVDAGISEMLREELARVIASTGGGVVAPAAPDGEHNRVDDLATIAAGGGAVTLVWRGRNIGDYDGDGVVGINDLTPLGRFYGATSDSADWVQAKHADGNGDGEVNLGDVTPVGMNFCHTLDGYRVYRGQDGTGLEQLAFVARVEANTLTDGCRLYTYIDTAQQPGRAYIYEVRPVMLAGAVEGISSTQLEVKGGSSYGAEYPKQPQSLDVQLGGSTVEAVSDMLLVSFKAEPTLGRLYQVVDELGGELLGQLADTNTYRVVLPEATGYDAGSLIALKGANFAPDCTIELNILLEPEVLPDDPLLDQQWALAALNAQGALETGTGLGVRIGVIDTGLRASHEDLAEQCVPGYSVSGEPLDDEHGHGTWVAGVIAAAAGNSAGIAGLAHGAELVPIKAGRWVETEAGPAWRFPVDELVEALDWAVTAGDCDVVNLSLGGAAELGIAFEAKLALAEGRGVVVTASAGNSGSEDLHYPAAYPGVISVGSVNKELRRAGYSNYGFWVDLWAPGGESSGHDEMVLTCGNGDDYEYIPAQGTSIASAYAAAAAALVIQKDPVLTPGQVRQHLADTARELQAAGKLIDVQAALAALEGGATMSGTILDESGMGLSWAAVNLTGAAQATTHTTASGYFSFTHQPDGEYLLAPALPGYSFTPPVRSLTVSGADVSGLNFTAVREDVAGFDISGTVTYEGSGLPGVRVGCGSLEAVTNISGEYLISGVNEGPHNIVPGLAGFSFTPSFRSIDVIADLTGIDFSASEGGGIEPDTPNTISGFIRLADATPVPGLTVNLTGASVDSDVTIGNGSYTLTTGADGAHTVTPAATPSFTFAPPSINLVTPPDAANQNFVATPQGSVSGQVTDNGVGLNGVTMQMAGYPDQLTAGGGFYTFSNVLDGAHAVTPSLAGQSFIPASRIVNVVNGGAVAGQDFALNLYNISGTVRLLAAAPHSSDPLAGLGVNLGGAGAGVDTTDAAGAYSFLSLWAGNGYTISPDNTNFTIAPAVRNVNLPPTQANQNFTATPRGSISGTVSWPGHPSLPGVTMTLVGQGGAPNYTYTTATTGAYSISPVFPDSYVLTPSKAGQTFTPATRSPVVTNANVGGQNFTVDTYTISGNISLPAGPIYSGDGFDGLSVDLTGDEVLNTTTAGGGNYSFANLLAGNYTVTPTATPSFTFTNVSESGSTGPGDWTGVDFLATPNGAVSGTVTWPGHGPLDGVAVSMTGQTYGYTFTMLTAGGGNYSFANVLDDTWDMTLTYGTNTFTPSASPYTFAMNNGASLDLDFTINTYTISGWIDRACANFSGVTIDLTGAETLTMVTPASGNYSFANLLNGNYTVTPSLANFTLDPVSRAVTVTNADRPGQGFHGIWDFLHTMTVTVTLADGNEVENVRLSLTGTNTHSGFTTAGPYVGFTDVNGQYTFNNMQDACLYSITQSVPSRPPGAFSFPNSPYNMFNVRTDLAPTIIIVKNWFDVTGYVTDFVSGLGINGISVVLTGDMADTVTTGNDYLGNPGYFELLSLPNGLYWVTPVQGGNGFDPSTREVNINEGDMPNQDFVRHAGVYSVSGNVSEADGTPVPGVTVDMFSQTNPLSDTTDANGDWTIGGVIWGQHLFTPSLAGWTFTPSSTVVNVTQVATGVNFTGTDNSGGGATGTVSGRCSRPNGNGIAGVTMTLDGTPGTYVVTTDGSGSYQHTSVPNGNYTLTPYRSGFIFVPLNRNVTVSGNNVTGQDFTGN